MAAVRPARSGFRLFALVIRARYDRETDIRYAAARGWIDAIIDPARTREMLALALDVATRRRDSPGFGVGVFQV